MDNNTYDELGMPCGISWAQMPADQKVQHCQLAAAAIRHRHASIFACLASLAKSKAQAKATSVT